MRFSIRYIQNNNDIPKEKVIGLIELLGVDANNKKVVFLHIKIYHTALKEFGDLSKPLCELAIRDVFEGKCTELKHPIQSKKFIIYTVESDIDNNIDPIIFVSKITIRLNDEIHKLTSAESPEKSKTSIQRY